MQFPGMVRVIAVQAKGPELMKEAEEQINALLRQSTGSSQARTTILPSEI